MKLLFDQNISCRIIKKLQTIFPKCCHVSECELSNCNDNDIWAYARDNGFAIITFDSDFYDISLILGHPPKIIWLRAGNLTTTEIATLLIKHQNSIFTFLEEKTIDEPACLEIEQ